MVSALLSESTLANFESSPNSPLLLLLFKNHVSVVVFYFKTILAFFLMDWRYHSWPPAGDSGTCALWGESVSIGFCPLSKY